LSVLITGESGAGKDLAVPSFIHSAPTAEPCERFLWESLCGPYQSRRWSMARLEQAACPGIPLLRVPATDYIWWRRI